MLKMLFISDDGPETNNMGYLGVQLNLEEE
jgi:hypothetical protein